MDSTPNSVLGIYIYIYNVVSSANVHKRNPCDELCLVHMALFLAGILVDAVRNIVADEFANHYSEQ